MREGERRRERWRNEWRERERGWEKGLMESGREGMSLRAEPLETA